MQKSQVFHGSSIMLVYSRELGLVEKAHKRLLKALESGNVAEVHVPRVDRRLQGQREKIARLNQLISERQLGLEPAQH